MPLIVTCRVATSPGKSWKVLEKFKIRLISPGKVLEFYFANFFSKLPSLI